MEVIIALVLILLGAVGARNIPVHVDESSKPSYTSTPLAGILPARELAESVVYVEDIGLHLNKNTAEDKIVKDHADNIVFLDENLSPQEPATYSKQKVSKNNQGEEMNTVSKPMEVASEAQEDVKVEVKSLEDRAAIAAGCPTGQVRVGNECWEEQ